MSHARRKRGEGVSEINFDYVKDADSGKYFVKNGEWVGENI